MDDGENPTLYGKFHFRTLQQFPVVFTSTEERMPNFVGQKLNPLSRTPMKTF